MSSDPKEAALKGRVQSVSKAEVPADFAAVFHCASIPGTEWPKTVQAWGDKSEANQHVLDALRSEASGHPSGGCSPLAITLIAEVLKAVGDR